jgi:hypothetical protein
MSLRGEGRERRKIAGMEEGVVKLMLSFYYIKHYS